MDNRNNLAMLAVLYGSAFVAAFNENTINVALISIMGEFAVDANTAPVARNGLHDRHGHRGNGIGLSHQAAAPFARCS